MSDRTDIEIPATGLLPDHQEDASATDRPQSAREQMMESIVAKRQRALEAEMGEYESVPKDAPDAREQNAATRKPNASLGEVEEDRDYHDPYAVEEQAAGEALAPVASPSVPETGGQRDTTSGRETTPVASPHTQTFAVEVDGQQLHVTQDQLLHLARMGVVANQALYRYQMQGQPVPLPPPESQRSAQPAIDAKRIEQTVEAIQYGDKTTAAQALTELVNHVVSQAPGQQQIDVAAIERRAAHAATLQASAAARLEHDTEIIRREYADLFENPIRSDAAARQLLVLRQEAASLGRNRSELELYREAGDRVRAAFGLPATPPRPGGQTAPADAGFTAPQASNLVVRRSTADIEGRKRAAPRATSQVIDRRSAAPQAPRPPSGADIVEMMRKSRGQTSMR